MDRLSEIERFEPTKYWKANFEAKLSDGKSYPLSWKVPSLDVVEDTRNKNQNQANEQCATLNQESANDIVEQATGSDIYVSALIESSQTISPP